MKRLLFIGNFQSPYSTENDLKWTFEKLGWEVVAIQENHPRIENELLDGHNMAIDFDLMLYVHTHGWGDEGMIEAYIETCEWAKTPTASFHLDRFWGLNIADKREDLIGQHPFWHTDFVFTADGGNHDWKDRGINHHWLKPAVIERDCYLGTPRDDFKVDVAFVGSRYYHPEYPQRAELIGWLQETYKDKFRRFAGDESSGTVRGKDLNDLYASVKVVVGDSCFAMTGVENYWSDRIPETTGRGGFLIHPEVKGLEHPGVKRFLPGDYDALQAAIDYYLEHDEQREHEKLKGYNWTKNNATYTNRVTEMLGVIGI